MNRPAGISMWRALSSRLSSLSRLFPSLSRIRTFDDHSTQYELLARDDHEMSLPESGSYEEKGGGSDDKHGRENGGETTVIAAHHLAFAKDEVDAGASLVAGGIEVDPEESIRIRKKIDRHILPLMCSEFFLFLLSE